MMLVRNTLTSLTLVFSAVLPLAASSPGDTSGLATTPTVSDTIIVPHAVLMPDGSLTEGKAVVIRDGRIHAIEDASLHDANEEAIRRPGAVLSPGLIDAYSALGVFGGNTERFDPVDPAISVLDAIDEYDSAWRTALEAGVTAAVLVPGSNNLIAGATAVVRTYSAADRPEVLHSEAHLMLSFGSPALSSVRAPTSRAGAMAMLRNVFADASQGNGHGRLTAVLDESLGVLVRADSGEDVTAALRFFESYGLAPIIVHSDDLLDVQEDLIEAQVPVVVGPYSLNTPHHELIAPGRLHRAGVPIIFAGQTPLRGASAIRQTASLAVRAGMEPSAARRAFTVNAARMAGVHNRIGSVAPGMEADLVLFSADPLRLEARVLEVYIAGELMYVIPSLGEEIERISADDVLDDPVDVTGDSDDGSE